MQLSIRNLTKHYKTGEGVSDISIDVEKGELVTLLGPSGCGKTTVLRTIGGFLEPDSGDILIKGKSVLKLPPEKRPTSMVFQGYNLWPHMTVYENLGFGLKIRKVKKAEMKKAIRDVLELVRMPGSEKKYPAELSGGQQQRVAVARSLLLKPDVLLLDEPFSALDAKLRNEMREELRDIQGKTGLTMVFVTHDQEEALSISDRIVVINQGCIEQIATTHEIYDHPKTLFVAQFIGKMNFVKGVAQGETIKIDQLEFPNENNLSGNVVTAIRPEDVVFSTIEGDGLPGTIKQITVLGHYTEVSLDVQGQTIKAYQPRNATTDLCVKQKVTVNFSKMLSYPVLEQ